MTMAFPQPGFEKLTNPSRKEDIEEPLPLDQYLTSEGTGNNLFIEFCTNYLTIVVKALIGKDHPNEVENLVQDATIKAMLNLGNFKRESSLKTWINRIGTNTVFSFLRKVKIHKEDSLEDILRIKEDIVDSSQINAFENTELLQKILKGVINEKQKRVLLLFYLEGHSIEEISDITGEKINTVKMQLSRAKGKALSYAQKKGYTN